jgi:hypothetical protein
MAGVNTLSIFVDNIDDALASFDSIRVQRAELDTGPWTEITADGAQSAVLLGSEDSPFAVVAKTMQLQVDSGNLHDIVFTGTDPLTVDQVADQINAVEAGVASDLAGKLNLESTLNGTQSKIYLPGGGALTDLGFTAGDRDIGEEDYVDLVPGESVYNFYDRDGNGTGSQTFFYRVAFYNQSSGLTSDWSEPFEAEPGTVITAGNLSIGGINLVDAAGVSQPDHRITFYPLHEPLEVEGFHVALMRAPITVVTNNSGYAEVTLVRGLRVKMVIEGTAYVREFTVPDQPTFDVLEIAATAPDPFNPVEPDYPYAIRRTL